MSPDAATAVSTNRPLPDRLARNLRLLICGTNPSPASANARIGYFRPGNRFWPAALAAGVVTADRDPAHALRVDRVGFTDFVARVEADASKITPDELRAGAVEVEAKIRKWKPAAVCFTALGPYRTAVDRRAVAGAQPRPFGGRPAYVMPSTSGRNASTSVDALTEHFRAALTLADTAAAALANAKWCRSQSSPGSWADMAWTTRRRTPEFYPDAVTLHPYATADDVLPFIDASAGASVKDSFATLDLTAHGFEVLLEGTWVRGGYGEKGAFDWFVADELDTELAKGGEPIAPMRVWIKP